MANFRSMPLVDSERVDVSTEGALEQLFPDASERGVLLDHWAEGRFFVEHGAPKELEERIAERFPTPEALAEHAPDIQVSVYGFVDASRAEGAAGANDGVQDLYTFPPTTAKDAVSLYHAGHTIICWRILDQLPEAIQRGADILKSIGLPHQPIAARGLPEPWSSSPFVVSLVYTPAGCTSGLGMHFDRFDSVVVQLRGQKNWRVGRHPHLQYPIYNEEVAAQQDFPPSLPRLAARTELVEDLEDIELRQGSSLLLPRGIYHTTLADNVASLSIGYHFALPTWSHVVLAALERGLTRDPIMRTTPFGAFSTTGPSAGAQAHMARAVERAREALADPRQLLEVDLLGNLASHHQAAFRLAPHAVAELSLGEPPVITNYGGYGLEVELPDEADRLCRWIRDRAPNWFDMGDALTASAGRMGPRSVWNFLQEAVEAGLLERRWGRPEGACDPE